MGTTGRYSNVEAYVQPEGYQARLEVPPGNQLGLLSGKPTRLLGTTEPFRRFGPRVMAVPDFSHAMRGEFPRVYSLAPTQHVSGERAGRGRQ